MYNDEREINYEEVCLGLLINITNNPDRYTGGYEYTVSSADEILSEGLEFEFDNALSSARQIAGKMAVGR